MCAPSGMNMKSCKSIPLYWWTDNRNFGDNLSLILWKKYPVHRLFRQV